MLIEFDTSWEHTIAKATQAYGEDGRKAVLLRRGELMESKRRIAAEIRAAGYDVDTLLKKWNRAWTKEGLAIACGCEARWIEEGLKNGAG